MPPCDCGGGRDEEGAVDWEGMAGARSIQKHVLADVKTERRVAVGARILELQTRQNGSAVGSRVLENCLPACTNGWTERPTQQLDERARRARFAEKLVRRVHENYIECIITPRQAGERALDRRGPDFGRRSELQAIDVLSKGLERRSLVLDERSCRSSARERLDAE